jgi:ESS family glutamate:Na+ symporter
MIAFFTSIGWMASIENLKKGGREVILFLVLCSCVLILQNAVGMVLASSLGEPRLLGVLAGSVSLTGGPGTALAFAPAFEKAGVVGAGTIGTACALLGIILGGLLGAPVAATLVGRLARSVSAPKAAPSSAKVAGISQAEGETLERAEGHLVAHLKLFLVVMALGSLLGKWIQDRGITLPIYIGAMVIAALVRNVLDARERAGKKTIFSGDLVDEMGTISLAYFLVIATMTLQFRQLQNLAGTLALILGVQTIIVLVIARWGVFRFFGRDYDAAVMAGGFVGFMLGTTANAMANMNSVSARYAAHWGHPHRAFVVVPLVGACFIDFVNALVITYLTRG